MMTTIYDHQGYHVGHCWYYRLGGDILKPKAIGDYVRPRSGRGYMADEIDKIDRMAEPQRSDKLRQLQDKFRFDLAHDVSGYRQVAHKAVQWCRRKCFGFTKKRVSK